MGDCKKILIRLIQFYLALQFIFILFCLTFFWQSDYEKKDIIYLVLKDFQYFNQLVIFRDSDFEKYLKYHIAYYLLMDLYGLLLIKIKVVSFWIIVSQLLIGGIVIGCICVYCLLYTILSYIKYFICRFLDEKFLDLLWYYLFVFTWGTFISLYGFLYQEYSTFDFYYQIIRFSQYIITLLVYEKKGKKDVYILHYIIDSLLNLCGLLYLKNENIYFWVIICQIALGCFHYYYMLIIFALTIIFGFRLTACAYVNYRLQIFLSGDSYENKRMLGILYLMTQIAFTFYILITHFFQSKFHLTLSELIYLTLKAIQYLIHFIDIFLCQDFGINFDFHFSVYFIMDIYGLIILNLSSQIFWIVFFQIIVGFIVYYLLCIEFIKYYVKEELIGAEDSRIFIVPFLMLEIGFSALIYKFDQNSESYYVLFRILFYVQLLLLFFYILIKKEIPAFQFLMSFTFLSDIWLFVWGLRLIYQGQRNVLNLQYLYFDFIWFGALLFPYDKEREGNPTKIVLQRIKCEMKVQYCSEMKSIFTFFP